ncbi:hypothetical protein AVEN_110490-1, partial [Araneus ventricosus]
MQRYLLWGLLRPLIYSTPIGSDEGLIARLSVPAATVREIAGIFER